MEIYPAIDLINGRCVRLSEGDYNARTDYDIDPLTMAMSYKPPEHAGCMLSISMAQKTRQRGKRK